MKEQDHIQSPITYIFNHVIQLEKEIKREFYNLNERYNQVYH